MGIILIRNNSRTFDVSNGITAYLRGGLGNQLFIFAAALQQSRLIDCPLYVDVSWFDKWNENSPDTQRFLEIQDIISGFQQINQITSPWAGKDPSSSKDRQLQRILNPKIKVFVENTRVPDGKIFTTPGTTISGYFQDRRYFDEIEGELFNLIHPQYERGSRNTITVHVRRGDYLNPDTYAYHGMVSERYISRSMALFRRMNPSAEFRIFSDSIALVKSELAGQLNCVYEDSSDTALQTIRTMSEAQGMIMSNSSFSWWAAWIMSFKSDPLIVAPRPWYNNQAVSPSFILDNWFQLGR